MFKQFIQIRIVDCTHKIQWIRELHSEDLLEYSGRSLFYPASLYHLRLNVHSVVRISSNLAAINGGAKVVSKVAAKVAAKVVQRSLDMLSRYFCICSQPQQLLCTWAAHRHTHAPERSTSESNQECWIFLNRASTAPNNNNNNNNIQNGTCQCSKTTREPKFSL